MHAGAYGCIWMHMHAYWVLGTYIHAFIHTYIHTYIHTHIHAYVHRYILYIMYIPHTL